MGWQKRIAVILGKDGLPKPKEKGELIDSTSLLYLEKGKILIGDNTNQAYAQSLSELGISTNSILKVKVLTIAGQETYSIPQINGKTIDEVRLGGIFLTLSPKIQYSRTGAQDFNILDPADPADIDDNIELVIWYY